MNTEKQELKWANVQNLKMVNKNTKESVDYEFKYDVGRKLCRVYKR